jgi:hypothetical protein
MSFTIYEKWNDDNATVNTTLLFTGTLAGAEIRSAQMFPCNTPHLLNKLRIRLKRFNGDAAPHNVTISIKGTSVGLPSGDDLCSYVFDGTTISKTGWGGWYDIPFSSGANLTAGATYAIVIVAPQFIRDNPPNETLAAVGTYYTSSQYQYGKLLAQWSSATGNWSNYGDYIKYGVMFEEGTDSSAGGENDEARIVCCM